MFVGAGISRLIGCPSWDGFADAVLDQLAPHSVDYYALSQIKAIKDPKKRLSLAQIIANEKGTVIKYEEVLKGSNDVPNVYTYLNRFNCSFVTTNYEKYLRPDSMAAKAEAEWRIYGRDKLLGAKLDVNGNVIHLHGCIDDEASLVITTRQYLDHHTSTEVQAFLTSMFARKVVLFLGYGLEETEILEYILRRGDAKPEAGRTRRYILQGFFNAESGLSELLTTYFREAFSTELVSFNRDHEDFKQQISILKNWSEKLSFSPPALMDEAAALEQEING